MLENGEKHTIKTLEVRWRNLEHGFTTNDPDLRVSCMKSFEHNEEGLRAAREYALHVASLAKSSYVGREDQWPEAESRQFVLATEKVSGYVGWWLGYYCVTVETERIL